MALQTPTWLQAGTYSAKEDRSLLDATFTEGIVNAPLGGFLATQRAAGANNSVDVASGLAVIQGDDENDQGKYLVRNVGSTNVAFDSAPASNSRIDVLYVRVNDSTAGGPAGDNATFGIVKGTAAGSPTVPATPTSAIALARVLRTAGDTSITTAMITDLRTDSSFTPSQFTAARLTTVREPFTVVASAATGTINMDCGTTSALWYTTNATANWTLNVRASSTDALTTIVPIGDAITVTFAATQGLTAYFQNVFQVDGATQAVKWQDAATPISGTPSSIDIYTMTCVRTATSTWAVFGTRTTFA